MKSGIDYIGVGCGAFILNNRGEILLMLRSAQAKNDASCWAKVGGEVDYGEKVEAALKREIKEELGVEAVLKKFLGFTDQIMPKESHHWLSLHFVAELKQGEPRLVESHKHEKLAWFKIDSLPVNLARNTADSLHLLKNYLGA